MTEGHDGIYVKIMVGLRDRLHELPGAQLPCLLAIALHWDGEQSWPSIRKIARETGLSKTTIYQALQSLEKNHWIKRKYKKGCITSYSIASRLIQMGNSSVSKTDTGVPITDTPNKGSVSNSGLGVSNSDTGVYQIPVPEEESIEEGTKKKEPPLRGGMTPKADTDPWLSLAKHFRKRFPGDRRYPLSATRDHLANEYDGEYTLEQVYDQIDKRAKEGAEDLKPWELFTPEQADDEEDPSWLRMKKRAEAMPDDEETG